MHEYQRVEFFALRPERIEPARGQLLALDRRADCAANQAEGFHRIFELRGGEFGKLQGYAGEGDQSAVRGLARLCEFLVLNIDQLLRQAAIGAVPELVDAHRLDVDALRVHGANALFHRRIVEWAVQRGAKVLLECRAGDDGQRGRDYAMAVNVNYAHRLAVNLNAAAQAV